MENLKVTPPLIYMTGNRNQENMNINKIRDCKTEYRAYFRNGKYPHSFLTSYNLSELIEMIIKNGVPIRSYPKHYLEGILNNDKTTKNGRICSWGNLEIKKGEDQMTEYTSF